MYRAPPRPELVVPVLLLKLQLSTSKLFPNWLEINAYKDPPLVPLLLIISIFFNLICAEFWDDIMKIPPPYLPELLKN